MDYYRRLLAPIAIAAVLLALALAAACSDSNDGNGNGAQPTVAGGATQDSGRIDSGPVLDFAGRDPGVAFTDACQKTDEKQFTEPEAVLDPSKTYVATIRTPGGDIVLQLFSDVPVHTNNFVFLACKGFYDGLTFHRVVRQPVDFVAQGGDPDGNCRGGPGYEIPDESSAGHRMDAGVISMAKSGPNTTGSQFFITYEPQPDLEPDFTTFGVVTEGMDALDTLQHVECGVGAPPESNNIESITITEE